MERSLVETIQSIQCFDFQKSTGLFMFGLFFFSEQFQLI